jgi:hypothetical protein
MVGLLGRVISPSQGLYLHRTTQHKKTRTNIHVLSGIRTHHDPSNLPAKTHASDRTATVTGFSKRYPNLNNSLFLCEFNLIVTVVPKYLNLSIFVKDLLAVCIL